MVLFTMYKANARLANAREHDLISNSDFDAGTSGHESQGSSLQTVRGREKAKAKAPEVADEHEVEVEDIDDEYLSLNPTSSRPTNRVKSSAGHTGTGLSNLYAHTKSVKDHDQSVTSISGTLPSNLLPESDSFPVQPISPSSGSNGKSWTIQIHKPPISTRVVAGPIKWSHLMEKLGIDKDTVRFLQSCP